LWLLAAGKDRGDPPAARPEGAGLGLRFARPSRERKTERKYMTEGIIFYTGKKRIGKLQITRLCFNRMNQYGIITDELEEVFRYGREIEEGKIELGQICLFYVLDETRIFRGEFSRQQIYYYHLLEGGE
jgi:hypothetical protein